MDPQQLPLEPLISPPDISWWPLAPIWWILIGFILFFLLTIVIYLWQKKNRNKKPLAPEQIVDLFRKEALDELKSFQKPYQQPVGPWLQKINILLKRICITHYPNEQIRTLTGKDWLMFLSKKCQQANIQAYSMLVDKEYHPNYFLDNETIDHIYSSIETWINHYD